MHSPVSVGDRTSQASPGATTATDSPTSPVDAQDTLPHKPKQRRNKPTLSCQQCVERKTKCDRGRPICLACIKRQSECHYSQAANLIASAEHGATGNARYISRPPKRAKPSLKTEDVATTPQTEQQNGGVKYHKQNLSQSTTSSSPFLLSNAPYTKSTPSSIFGIGSGHPFANYWTCQGGLPEVIGVLPSKDQADILIESYFTCVDPVYPMLSRSDFYADYEAFWALPPAEKCTANASMLGLHFAMYATGTQFVQVNSYQERTQSAEFYVSAAHQALSIASYMNRTSMQTIQAMVLIVYFLMNDNHATDAWAFAGILLRQAYAMGLNRDPDTIVANASLTEKQQRRKLWQAVMFQDTFLTVLLKLPPTATHSDVTVDALTDEPYINSPSSSNADSTSSSTSLPILPTPSPPVPPPRTLNQMSISAVCAHPEPPPPSPMGPPALHHTPDPNTTRSDIAYIRTMWRLANTVQETICSPLSLSLPLSSSPRNKSSILSSFRTLYRSFPNRLTILDHATLRDLCSRDPRVVRQNLFLTSNYFHCLMVLHADENRSAGVECNYRGALEAAIEAIGAFWKLWGLFEKEAEVWWVFGHRAFEEALMMANILAGLKAKEGSEGAVEGLGERDPILKQARMDVERMLDFLERGRGSQEMLRTRWEVLREVYERVR